MKDPATETTRTSPSDSKRVRSRFAALALMVLGFSVHSTASADFASALAAVKAGDYPLALVEFKRLAAQGDPRGENGLGALYLRGNAVPLDLVEAFRLFESAAGQGFAAAQANLAMMYDNGWGTAEDAVRAAHWYGRAAANGNVEGQAAFGKMLATGRGVPADPKAAFQWLHKAAMQASPIAQAFLGHLFRAGDGVERDYVKAYAWYGLAAAGGYQMGPELRDTVAEYLSPGELEEARRLARTLYQRINPDS